MPSASTRDDRADKSTHTATSAGLVTAIGDSAKLGAIDALQREIPNLALLDAQGSRQVTAAIGVLKQYRTDGHLGDVVVVHIGNNGLISAGSSMR